MQSENQSLNHPTFGKYLTTKDVVRGDNRRQYFQIDLRIETREKEREKC